MARLRVQVDETHLKQLVAGPKRGLAELIWNALDADATTVVVEAVTSPLGAVTDLLVTDDGHGILSEDVPQAFGALGGSWKREARLSRGDQRKLHGMHGQGRLAAFALGDQIEWASVARDTEGATHLVRIAGRQAKLDEFTFSDPVAVDRPTGTVVRVDLVRDSAAKYLDRQSLADSLAAEFAIYLEQYRKVSITFRDARLDPEALQKERTEYQLKVKGLDASPTLLIIEWKRSVDRALYFCTADGMAVGETKVGIQAPSFDFTAYVKWDGFSGHDHLLGELGGEPYASVAEAARERLKQHFKERLRRRRRAVIEEWIAEGTYPYTALPTTPIESAERQAFELVAYAAASTVNGGDTASRKLSLRLLKEALETNPGNLHHVLRGVLDLPAEKLAELSGLLDRTTLSSVISTAKIVSDRLRFLSGLDTMLFDDAPRRSTLERRQLHRVLVNETWIFGEEYALMGDDEPLSKVLRKYLAFLGEDIDLADSGPVLRHDGTTPIPDLVMSRQAQHADSRVENLVVELKRPNVILGETELSQIAKYATAVTRDERFNRPDVTWDFWLVGNDLDELVEDRTRQVGLPRGCIQRTAKYKIFVFRWAEVIAAARHRLKFVQSALDFTARHDDGVQYLRDTHAKYLPPILAEASSEPGDV
ncbi:ATP-binding protein [Actinokineospora sp. 24-640]